MKKLIINGVHVATYEFEKDILFLKIHIKKLVILENEIAEMIGILDNHHFCGLTYLNI